MDLVNHSIKAVSEKQKKLGFIGAACSLAFVYAASAAPVPLYNTYRQTLGLNSSHLSLSAVAYFAGTLISLLIFARLSNYLGRRPVILATLATAAVGCFFFMSVKNVPMFMAGRLIQGLACGLASSTITTYVVDNAPVTPAWLGATVTSGTPNFGLAVGAFGSAAINQVTSGSMTLVYVVLIAALVGCAGLIAFGPETVAYSRGAVSSLVPQIRVPKNIRSLLPAASAAFIGSWAIGGFYQAFSSTMAAEQLGTTNTLAAAAIFACMMAPIAIGGSLSGRLKPVAAQRIGMSLFFLCIIAILITLKVGIMIPFLVVTVLAGITQGATFTGSMRGLLDKTSQKDRAGVLSTIYLISYSGAATPSLIVGRISGYFSLLEITAGYCAFVGVACLLTLIFSSFKRKKAS